MLFIRMSWKRKQRFQQTSDHSTSDSWILFPQYRASSPIFKAVCRSSALTGCVARGGGLYSRLRNTQKATILYLYIFSQKTTNELKEGRGFILKPFLSAQPFFYTAVVVKNLAIAGPTDLGNHGGWRKLNTRKLVTKPTGSSLKSLNNNKTECNKIWAST